METDDLVTYVELLKIHVNANHATAPNNSSKPEKAKRPELGSDVSDEDWSYFISRWKDCYAGFFPPLGWSCACVQWRCASETTY